MLGPSFQMSVAAVIALVAAYEAARPRLAEWRQGAGWGGLLLLYLAGVLLTTAVASAATAPFALYHFQRLASYGLAANLAAVPLTAFWIMPWGLVAYLLMPFGLEGLALTPMGWGVAVLLWIARLAADMPGAALLVPAMPAWGLAVVAAGGLWLCLWQRRWRLLGVAAIAVGLTSIAAAPRPDILINHTGSLMAVRDADGGLAVSSNRRDRFVRDMWLRRDGQAVAAAWPREGASADGRLMCDPLGCLYRRDGHTVALVRDPRALAEDCAVADVVVASVPVPWFCPAGTVVDRFDVWRHGAHALTFTRRGVVVDSVGRSNGDRPWTLTR